MKNKNKKPKALIVIGLGFGDEGKGLTVDWLCEKAKNPIVIRFSGGQQAGHTVEREGIKHTFSNFGAGTLLGISTYFSEHTTFYPVGIKYEKLILNKKGFNPKLIIHPMSRITTPWDVFENRACKTTLSNGSCGQGVGKTMKRNEGTYQLRAIDLFNEDIFRAKLSQIEKNYYIRKFKLTDALSKEISEFHFAIKELISDINALNFEIADYNYLKQFKTLIFEGSQGVMLDMDHGIFPNVTYANTTSKNAMEICDKLKIKDRHVYGVTRAYSTRHGKGDGEYEGEPIELLDTKHEININNKYQGEFLCTKLDYRKLEYAYIIENLYSKKYKHSLMVTCCNQVSSKEDFDLGLFNFGSSLKNVYKSYERSAYSIVHSIY